ncbi:hypothetical protein Q5762_24040 [Streptomyces sp. P9(2023)]|uniref:hypothetical protein n=1 Tax=Streptomyces sp. P9(2023) TaxID=3064394 RepID=UPI0028F41561|nr:hypothetical protein [Streptomyces sp. P9(2023)]MDT9691359.1 hypothetical protein [Streptomyces sp. P9(2023)]
MSPGTAPRPAPAAPAGVVRRAVLVVALALAALLGVAAGAHGPARAEARPPATSQPPDPGCEAHEVAEAEATATRRLRSRPRGSRPRDPHRPAAGTARPVAPIPVPAPLPPGDLRRCVVMRC